MHTRIAPVDDNSIREAAEIIRSGGLVAFPTETVYGLGANALDAAAVAAIYAAKGRPADNPLIAHIACRDLAESLVHFTPLADKLADKFWPGPLTLVLPSSGALPPIVSAGLPTAALRWPAHAAAAALIRAAGLPIAAPSANLSGRPSPTLAAHVAEDMAGRIPLILDGGPVDIGLESTVVDASGEYPVLLRPGRVTVEQLRELCGDCLFPDSGLSARPPAPGMKYRHYAPRGQLLLAPDYRAAEALRERILAEQGIEPLLLLSAESARQLLDRGLPPEQILVWGRRDDLPAYAGQIFAALRQADRRGARMIIAETVSDEGLGRAIMNRLQKAASAE